MKNKMNVGSYFCIGSTHLVCEDYAVSGVKNDAPYVFVSDGCSNGGQRIDTDFGSRLLCKASERYFDLLPMNTSSFRERVINTALLQAEAYFNLPTDCLLATLLGAMQIEDYIYSFMVGDGFIGGRKKDGTWKIFEYEFSKNAPYYLRYHLGDKPYFDYFHDQKVYLKEWQGEIHQLELKYTEELDIVNADDLFFEHEFAIGDYDIVFIASDGLSSFHRKVVDGTNVQTQQIALAEVLPVLFNFRDFKHTFVERQMNWALNTTKVRSIAKELGECKHFDDIAVGMIYCG